MYRLLVRRRKRSRRRRKRSRRLSLRPTSMFRLVIVNHAVDVVADVVVVVVMARDVVMVKDVNAAHARTAQPQ